MTTIIDITGREILDSRGNPTVEVDVTLDDGAFGREQCPSDVHTIADLNRLPGLLAARGYSDEDVEGIACGNFVRFLRSAWRA